VLGHGCGDVAGAAPDQGIRDACCAQGAHVEVAPLVEGDAAAVHGPGESRGDRLAPMMRTLASVSAGASRRSAALRTSGQNQYHQHDRHAEKQA